MQAQTKIIDLVIRNKKSSSGANKLSPGNIKRGLLETTTSIAMLQAYSSRVMIQPEIDFSSLSESVQEEASELAGITAHQRVITNHANSYLNDMQPRFLKKFTDISAVASQFSAFKDTLLVLAPNIATDEQTKGRFIDLLHELQLKTMEIENEAQDLLTDFEGFAVELSADTAAFEIDVEKAIDLVEVDEGKRDELLELISSTESAITGEIVGLVISALGIGGGVAMIIIGSSATLTGAMAGMGGKMILVGVAMIIGGAGGSVTSAVTLTNSVKTLSQAQTDLALLDLRLVGLQGLKLQAVSFSSIVEGGVAATQQIVNDWHDIQTNMASFIDQLETTSNELSESEITSALSLAGVEWAAVQVAAAEMQQGLLELKPIQQDQI
jgi:hypothetical protein